MKFRFLFVHQMLKIEQLLFKFACQESLFIVLHDFGSKILNLPFYYNQMEQIK
jgi:hypothetical protein